MPYYNHGHLCITRPHSELGLYFLSYIKISALILRVNNYLIWSLHSFSMYLPQIQIQTLDSKHTFLMNRYNRWITGFFPHLLGPLPLEPSVPLLQSGLGVLWVCYIVITVTLATFFWRMPCFLANSFVFLSFLLNLEEHIL